MPNLLSSEKSLYLTDHADNPVNWYPWGEAAWEKAWVEDKPVIVSIGYSSCHWCHVMARESFENAYIADLMNRHFICIKVDKEEHPEVDAVYMEAVQMITGRGGWPLNVFCLPDRRPFFGGTYFPPEDKGHGLIPWPQLLMRIADHYKRAQAELAENAEAIVHNLAHLNTPEGLNTPWNAADLLGIATRLAAAHDDIYGGFGGAPKFPCGMLLEFLLAATALPEGEKLLPRVKAIFEKSLTAMAQGGLYDQLGGGFMRYAVDRAWKVPHFEKMLYDNALLLRVYAKGYSLTQNPLFKATIEETFAWLNTTMKGPLNLFYTAQDAETAHGEGAVYKWTLEEVIAILGQEDGAYFARVYGIVDTAENQEGSLPVFSGTWADRLALAPACTQLKGVRDTRPQPAVDKKALLFWNALLVSGLTEAGVAVGDTAYLNAARQLLDGLLAVFERSSVLYSVAYEGVPQKQAGLVDYAALAEACLAVASGLKVTGVGEFVVYVEQAERLIQVLLTQFKDSSGVGYFDTSLNEAAVLVHRKSWLDNAIPSGHSILLGVFSSLHILTGKQQYAQAALELRQAYGGLMKNAPSGIAYALRALADRCIISVF